MKKRITVNNKRYGLLKSGLTWQEAGKLAKEWRGFGGHLGKRLAVRREYADGIAVFVRPLAYVD